MCLESVTALRQECNLRGNLLPPHHFGTTKAAFTIISLTFGNSFCLTLNTHTSMHFYHILKSISKSDYGELKTSVGGRKIC